MSHLARYSIAFGLLCSLSWAPDASAGSVTARVVTEAQIAPTITGTNADFKDCAGCLASSTSTGTVSSPAAGTSRSAGFGTALADFGVLKTFASSESSGINGSARATSTATFGDSLTIDASGLTGQSGTVFIPLQFDFIADVTGQTGNASGRAQLNFDVFVGVQTDRYQRAMIIGPNGQSSSQSFNPGNVAVPFSNQILAEVDFIFGEAFSFAATLRSIGAGSLDHRAEIDASHSAYWGGFQSVFDANGNAAAYSVSSGSGTDWSHSYVPVSAVPEPSTVALLLAGMGVIGLFKRRRPTPLAPDAGAWVGFGNLRKKYSSEPVGLRAMLFDPIVRPQPGVH